MPVNDLDRPARAQNVELLGPLEANGFRDRQWLIQRNGRFLQVTELLYRLLEHADGQHTIEEISAGVSADTDWLISSHHIRELLQSTLIPRGLVSPASPGAEAEPSRPAPQSSPLRVNLHMRAIGPGIIDPIARVLQILLLPPVLLALIIAAAIAHWWIYMQHGLAHALAAALTTPGALLGITAAVLVSGLFHEFGHAAALRYGGVRARSMGVGLYIVYPIFYTDSSEAYRLGRWARVRADAAGIYFDLVFALAVLGLYFATGQELLLIIVPLVDYRIVRQCLPFVRMDGYWALADLTGMPDLFSYVHPLIAALRRQRPLSTQGLPPLKRWAAAVFITYVAITGPVLAVFFFLLLRGVPYFFGASWSALARQFATFSAAQMNGDVLMMLTAFVQSFLVLLTPIALLYMLFSQARRIAELLWTLIVRRLASAREPE